MRKINKIMMATVSILLTLVLISSCVLSGIFAKYVTSKTASSQMQFEKFGVTVNMVVDEAKLERVLGADEVVTSAELVELKKVHTTKEALDAALEGKVWVEVSTPDQIKAGINTVTIHNLALKPGDDFTGYNQELGDEIYDLIQFTIGGTANVDCRVIIDMDFIYDPDAFVYDQSSGNKYMPLYFTWRLNDTTDTANYKSFSNTSLNNDIISGDTPYTWSLEMSWKNSFISGMQYNQDGFMHEETGRAVIDYSAYQDFSAGSDIEVKRKDVVINNINFGFNWPFYKEYTSQDKTLNYDERDTIISEKSDAKLDLSYTVKVEQKNPNAT